MRPTLSRSDFILRLFIDTNVLIDYFEDFDQKKALTFINLFKNSNFRRIELVTSDRVIWELYHYFKRDIYIRKMICDKKWGFKRAQQGSKKFSEATQDDMNEIGEKIKEKIDQLEENKIHIQRLMSREMERFSETVENLLRCSKFSYDDVIILVSSQLMNSHIIITIDEQFRGEASRISKLKDEKESLPLDFLKDSGLIGLKFEPPIEFSTSSKIKRKYREWFTEYNKEKKIGKVTDYWREANTCGIICLRDYTIKEKDYIFLVKFSPSNDIIVKSFRIRKNCLRDYDTNKNIKEGKRVTIKLPEGFSFNGAILKDAMVFISE